MEVRGPAGNVSQTFKGREGGRGCQEVAKTFTTQMLPPPNTKKKTPGRLNPKKLGEEVWGRGGRWDQGAGKAGEERSGWVSHIHTLGVETGHKRVLKVARVSEELLGSGARRRLCEEESLYIKLQLSDHFNWFFR